MTNIITDSHHEIFYRTVGLKISSHENNRSDIFIKSEDPYNPTKGVFL